MRETRVNERIRAYQVRLIDENGEMVGVMPPQRALDIARERNLDIVEISPNANPPVCKLMDYGRFKYEQAKKENEARKNQKTITLKEIRLSPRTDDHDVEVKTRKIQEFLAEGDRVRVSIKFRGAELRHPEIGRKLLDDIADVLKGMAVIERTPLMEGKMMSMTVSRAPGWEPVKKPSPAPPPSKKHHAQSTAPAQQAEQATSAAEVEDMDDMDDLDDLDDAGDTEDTEDTGGAGEDPVTSEPVPTLAAVAQASAAESKEAAATSLDKG